MAGLLSLRSNVVLWTEIMIWTSVLGTFLSVLGLYLGITQFKGGQGSPLTAAGATGYHIAGWDIAKPSEIGMPTGPLAQIRLRSAKSQ